MKKIFCTILTLVLLIACSNTVHANDMKSTIISVEDLGNGYLGITSIEIPSTALRASGTKTGTKTLKIENSNGDTIATFKLTASFRYSPSSVSCTSASYSTDISDSRWNFTDASAWKSGANAYGEFTIERKILGIPLDKISKTITLTCDNQGNLS